MPRTAHSGILAIDISNSFTKLGVSTRGRFGKILRIPTPELSAERILDATKGLRFTTAIFGSVVPRKNASIRRALGRDVLELTPGTLGGLEVDYPEPAKIGADRLANAIACVKMHGAPAIVVDFGTAVTFDVISETGSYIGGVIAPGLNALTDYLHERTALLPKVELTHPKRVVGKSTTEAILAGAYHGYRGLIAEIINQVKKEAFPRRRPKIIATGGDAKLIAREFPVFTTVEPLLTLHGLRIAAERATGINA